MLTYNTALWERLGLDTAGPNITVPSRVERRDAIIQQLKRACADVICLQEVGYMYEPCHNKNKIV